jgi:hypothetical protein
MSQNEPNQWICWDFGKNPVVPTHYQIRTLDEGYQSEWILEGSMDGTYWYQLDHRETTLSGVSTFNIPTVTQSRLIRMTQKGGRTKREDDGMTEMSDDLLVMAAFEIFGSFQEG